MPFFNFTDFCKKHNIPFFDKSCCVCIVGERNCGKTTSPLNLFMERATAENKVLICRTTEKQLKTQIQDFNNRFRGKFQIWGGLIYKLLPFDKVNRRKVYDNETLFRRGDCVGYVADLNNYHNYKSVEAKDVKMIFFDEVIQLDQVQLFYEKLINLFMTFARFNNPSILMVGNRDTPNNEIMVSWEIEPLLEAPKEDVVYHVGHNTWYIDLGTEQFKDLYDGSDGRDPHIVKTLAKFNTTTDLYLNEGGYLQEFSLKVVPFKKKLKETFDPLYLVSFGERLAVLGHCYDKKLCIVKHPEAIEKAKAENLEALPLDSRGYLVPETILTTKEVSDKILKTILIEYKKGNLFCDSFELLDFIKQRMSFYNI